MTAERLRFEPLAEHHAAALFDELGDARLYTYIPEDPPVSPAALAARYARLAAGSPDPVEIWRNWVMFDGARPIGTLQASVFADHRAMIAYMVLPRHWRQGYAAEGVRWMLDEVVERDRAETAEAFIDTRNRASLALVQRLGFTLRTTIRNADTFKGSSSDEHVYERRLVPGPR